MTIDLTVAEAVTGPVRWSTETDYRSIVTNHLIPALGKVRLTGLRPQDVTRLHRVLKALLPGAS